MHVAVIASSFPRAPGDAAGHFVLTEVEQLVARGDAVSVLAPGERLLEVRGASSIPFGAAQAFGWPGVLPRLRRRPLNAVELLLATARARALLRALPRVDRVIAHWLVPCGWPIATALDAPLEIVAHGSDVRLLLALPPALRRHVLARLFARDTRFRFVSEELRRSLVEVAGPALAARSRVEPCAISLSGVPERAQARSELSLGGERRLAVIVARLVAGKRVAVALAAAALVPRLHAVVIGDGPERVALERAFPQVRFLGQLPRSDVLRWISAADVVLSASRREGAPTVIREARALGVPVVTTPCGDVTDWARSDPELHVIGA